MPVNGCGPWRRFQNEEPDLESFLQRYRREFLVLSIGAFYIIVCAIVQRLNHHEAVNYFLDNVRWTMDCALGVLLLIFGFREAGNQDRRPRAWFMAGWLVFAFAQVLWNIQVIVGWVPFPGPADFFYNTLPICVSIGFLSVLFKGLSPGEARAVLLDIISIFVMSLTLTLALYLPLWHSTSAAVNVTAIVYPVLYLTEFGIAVLTVLTRKIPPGFSSLLAVLGLAIWAACWLDWNLRVLRGENLTATLSGYGFSVGNLLCAAALGKWRSAASTNPTLVRWAFRVQRLFPLILVSAACFAIVFGHRHFGNLVSIVIDIGAVTMIVLAAARQSLVLFEQDQLLDTERRLRISERHEAEARRETDRFKHNLSVARSIQQGLLPTARPKIAGYDIAGWNQPAEETGGDYYDWQTLGDGRMVVSIADATGHGIGPALVTSVCRAYSRACMDGGGPDLRETLSHVNRLLASDLRDGRFVTFCAAVLDAPANSLELISAGHGPIFHYSAATKTARSLGSNGLPLAIDASSIFDPVERLHLAPGDFVAVFTDGFSEWCDTRGEQFGVQRLGAALVRHADRTATEVLAAVYADLIGFVTTSPQLDDLTVIIIKRDTADATK